MLLGGGIYMVLSGSGRPCLAPRSLDRLVGRRSSFTRRISTLYPNALAYRRSVAIDGECFGAADSRRAIADWVVPTRAATSACERPDSDLALSTSSRKANSSARSSYAFFTFGRANARALNCFRVLVMLHFPHPLSRDIEFLEWRLVCLLHELVQEDNSSADDRAKEHTRNSLRGFDPKFEQPATHRTS